MKNRVNKSKAALQPKTKVLVEETFKPVTFMLPAHVAQLIEETREQLGREWEEWVISPAMQSLKRDELAGCLSEFESLMVEGSFIFDNGMDRRRFMQPIHKALIVAWKAEHQFVRETAVAA